MVNENLRLGHSPITDRVYLGKMNKDGKTWADAGKKDVTNDFLACVIGRWNGFVETITGSDGKVYEISVKEKKESV